MKDFYVKKFENRKKKFEKVFTNFFFKFLSDFLGFQIFSSTKKISLEIFLRFFDDFLGEGERSELRGL